MPIQRNYVDISNEMKFEIYLDENNHLSFYVTDGIQPVANIRLDIEDVQELMLQIGTLYSKISNI